MPLHVATPASESVAMVMPRRGDDMFSHHVVAILHMHCSTTSLKESYLLVVAVHASVTTFTPTVPCAQGYYVYGEIVQVRACARAHLHKLHLSGSTAVILGSNLSGDIDPMPSPRPESKRQSVII
jgi:hypothetical protein